MPDTALTPPHFRGPIWLIANPIAGGRGARRRLEQAIALLRARLTLAEIRWTQRRGDAEKWAREAVARNVSLVIGFGGDGTLNELANGLAGSEVALALLPAGTANVVACELGIPLDPAAAARALLAARPTRLHLALAEYTPLDTSGIPAAPSPLNPSRTPSSQRPATGRPQPPASDSSFILHPSSFRFFLFAAGLGFDAHVCYRVSFGVKRWGRKAAYLIAGFQLLLRYQSPRLEVALDAGAPLAASELIVANARAYGGRFFIAPDASFHKPDLDACLFTRPGRLNLLRYALGIVSGRHTRYSDVIIRKAQTVAVTAERPAYLQLDGDTVGTTPARFTAAPDALTVLIP